MTHVSTLVKKKKHSLLSLCFLFIKPVRASSRMDKYLQSEEQSSSSKYSFVIESFNSAVIQSGV